VVQILQRFSTSNLTGLLGAVLLFWLAWPILCGALGAKRGLGMQGVLHGLLWGPLGLPIVLLCGRKHLCPTCGKRTLSTLPEASPVTTSLAPVQPEVPTPPAEPGGDAPVEARRVQLLPTVGAQSNSAAQDRSWRFSDAADQDCSEDEAAELYRWVNGD
jgi:hypothetical protein